MPMDAMHRTCSRLYFNFLIICWDHLDVVHLQIIYFGPISSNCIFRCHIIAAFKIRKNNFKYIKYDHLFSSREGDPHRPVNISGGSERDTHRERERGGGQSCFSTFQKPKPFGTHRARPRDIEIVVEMGSKVNNNKL